MQTVLAKDEHIVKTWNYSKAKVGSDKIKNELIVTNKRIIAHDTSKHGSAMQEVFMKDVKGVSGMYSSKGRGLKAFLICLAVALLTALGELIYEMTESFPFYAEGITILVIAGIVLLVGIILFFALKSSCFALDVSTYGPSVSVAVGTLRISKKGAGTVRIKVRVDYNEAAEILSTIGAYVLSFQSEKE